MHGENHREAPNSACIGRDAKAGDEGVTEEATLSSRMSGHSPNRGQGRIPGKREPSGQKPACLLSNDRREGGSKNNGPMKEEIAHLPFIMN